MLSSTGRSSRPTCIVGSASPENGTHSLEGQLEKPKSKKRSETSDTCLQCHVLGLRCSFTSEYQLLDPKGMRIRKCSRCLRNKEDFCITYSYEVEIWISPGIKDSDLRERINGLEGNSSQTLRSPPPLPRSETGKEGLVKSDGLWRWPRYVN